MVLVGCSGVPSGIIQPDDMAALLADLDLGEAFVDSDPGRWRNDSMKLAFRQSIYLYHGFTSEEVDTSMKWYVNHMDKYVEVSNATVEILEDRIKSARSAGALTQNDKFRDNTSADGDSIDVWTMGRFIHFNTISPSRIYNFVFTRDRNWEPGDIYELSFKVLGAPTSIDVALAADYTGGKGTDYVASRINTGERMKIRLNLDSVLNPTNLYGSIACLNPKGLDGVYIDSIALVRMHLKPGRRQPNPAQHRLHKNY